MQKDLKFWVLSALNSGIYARTTFGDVNTDKLSQMVWGGPVTNRC